MAGWPVFDDPDQITQGINAAAKGIKQALSDWSATIAASSQMTGALTAEHYQQMAGFRLNMTQWVGEDAPDINTAMARRKSGLGGFDAAARWAELETQISAFLDWIAANWPERTADGWLAWQKVDATKQLTDGVVTLTAAQKNAVVNRLNAIISNLPTQN
jgi:hypothetical protein